MKFNRLLILTLTLFSVIGLRAQKITSVSEIDSDKAYVIRNANSFGYCIYNPEISTKFATLGGGTAIHPNGNYNPLYQADVDVTNKNNQWYIIPNGKGEFYLYNIGKGQYLTNKTVTINNFGWGDWESILYAEYFFTDDKIPFTITAIDGLENVFAFRLAEVYDTTTDSYGYGDTKYMCAATQKENAIAYWKTEDPGSQWYIELANGKHTDDKDDSGEDEGDKNPTDTETEENLGTLRYITFNSGEMIVIPETYIEKKEVDNDMVSLTLKGDTVWTYKQSDVASEDTTYNGSLPEFESFKFNNKFNDQLFVDAIGEIDSVNHRIDVSVTCIGKRLTPSFQVPDGAKVWVNGEKQKSKVTRRRFDGDVTYTVAYPKNYIYKIRKTSDEIWSTPPTTDVDDQWIKNEVYMTKEMLSTNAPSNDDYNQGLWHIADGEDSYGSPYYHSTWGNGTTYEKLKWSEGSYYGDGWSEWPYIEIELAEPVKDFQIQYTAGPSNRRWLSFIVQGSNNKTKWYDIKTFSEDKDGMTPNDFDTWTSPVLTNDRSYRYLRLQTKECVYKNYITLTELKLFTVEQNSEYGKDQEFTPELLVPAQYEKGFVPFGTDYNVSVKFMTEHSTSKYKVPRIDINTFNGTMISSKNYYWDASFKITGYGVYDDLTVDTMQIRGRGNSSWSNNTYAKNPYRMKFPSKIKPFGLTKGKNWVLLANNQSGSMTTNAIAMKLADMVETAGCNHIIPVELYINGDYRGSYNFTEKIGFSNNSVDIEDESYATMLELDSYYDEVYKFRDNSYNMYTNVKAPDFSDPTEQTNITFQDIKKAFNDLTYDMKIGGWDFYAEKDFNIELLAKAMLVTDLTRNQELKHPKSWYIYNENILADSAWVLGPVWDFDWSYGYDGTGQYFVYSAETDLIDGSTLGFNFFKQLWRGAESVKKAYYKEWYKFITSGQFDELIEFCDDYYDFANQSFAHNASKWGDGNIYNTHTTNAKNWLTKRANYIYRTIPQYDLSDDIITDGDDDDDNDDGKGDDKDDDGKTDRITLASMFSNGKTLDVYTLNGIRIAQLLPDNTFSTRLMPGIYIIDGHKIVVK